MTVNDLAWMLGGVVAGFAGGWLIVSTRLSARLGRAETERDLARRERERVERETIALQSRLDVLREEKSAMETNLESARRDSEAMTKFVDDARKQMEVVYADLSRKSIESISELIKPHLDGTRGELVSSLDAKKLEIDQLLGPVRVMLEKYQVEVQESETKRNRGYAALEEQLRHLLAATEETRRETSKVATALANPKVSGTWGETALRRCVELAGMTEYCDFTTQETFQNRDEKKIRPDMVVRLPQNRVIAVDAKAPMTAYLEASGELDEKRHAELVLQHARNLRRHIDQLGSREYHDSIQDSLDLTVMFVGGEQVLYAALSADPSLFEYGAQRKVFIATPMVLVPLLRVVSMAWRSEKSESDARATLEIGNELYERFLKVLRDIEAVGKALRTAANRYDEAIRSIDSRLLPKAAELRGHVASQKALPNLEMVQAPISTLSHISVVRPEDDDD